MAKPVKPRSYRSPLRSQQAHHTRRAVLAAASELFRAHGYAATTMAGIASAAGVALDTVYAAVGAKPVLFRLLLETALSGTDDSVPAEQRDYVLAIRAEPDAAVKLSIYASALARLQPRLAPLFQVLQQAATLHPELADLWREIAARRAANMRVLAGELEAAGGLRDGLTVDDAADVLWSLNSPELYLLLVDQRGWDPPRYERFLADAWRRLLLPT